MFVFGISKGITILALTLLAIAARVDAMSFSGIMKRDVSEVRSRLGCNATGPLGGEWAVDVSPCVAGQKYTCQVTDSSGCNDLDTSNIQQLIATSLVTGPCQPLGGAASIASTEFTCPDEKFAACTVTLVEGSNVAFGIKIAESS